MSPWSLPTFPSRRLPLRAAVARSSLCGDGTALHGNTMRGRCAAKSVCSVVARDVPAGPQGSLSVQRQPPWRRGRGAAERSPGDLRRPAELRGPVPRRPLALPPRAWAALPEPRAKSGRPPTAVPWAGPPAARGVRGQPAHGGAHLSRNPGRAPRSAEPPRKGSRTTAWPGAAASHRALRLRGALCAVVSC